ncbi:MAG: AsmA-like C-terminal domain-containing protein [Syntrophorhabdaceae bacterium]|nr:AsmA-like C-terminal domain-containing protein [Syntrophorhabdaceae bacterium]
MKKILYIISSILLFFLISAGIFYFYLPKTLSIIIGRAIKGNAHIERVEFSYKERGLNFHLTGIKLEGDLDGSVKSVYLSFKLNKEFCFNNIIISDFDIALKDKKKEGKPKFISIPSELVVLKKGIVRCGKNNFIIHEITIHHFKYKRLFYFSLYVENDRFFNSVEAKGTGRYTRNEFELKGDLETTGLKGENISDGLKGIINLKCNFNYKKGLLSLKGPFDIFDFTLKAGFFSKPLSIKNVNGNILLNYSKKTFDIHITGVEFKNIPFNIAMKVDSKGLYSLTLDSGYLDINDVKEYISFDYFSKDTDKYISFINTGKMMLKKLIYNRDKGFLCEIDLKNTEFTYDDIDLKNINAGFVLNNNKISLKNLYGQYKNSIIKNVSGEISHSEKFNISIKGSYSLNLTDLSSKFEIEDIKFKNGFSEGIFELHYRNSKDYSFYGKGTLKESEVLYKDISFTAHGEYRFTKDEIEFDPLILKKYNMNINIKGKYQKDFFDIRLSGMMDVAHIKPFVKFPFDIKGLINIDGDIKKKDGRWEFLGLLNLDHISYKIEHYLKKDYGIKNSLGIHAIRQNNEMDIRYLNFKLEDLTLNASGRLTNNMATEVKLKLLIPEIKDKVNIFFFNGEDPKGRILVDLDIKELSFPLKKIPYITGILEIKNGHFRIPDVPSPVREINMKAYFKGDTLDITGNNIKCGNSLINSLKFYSKGIDAPQFKLTVDIEQFDYKDLETPKKIMIYPIRPDSVLADAKGDIIINAKNVKYENKTGEGVSLKITYDDRKFIISELKANALDGHIDVHGTIDLSKVVPQLKFTGTMKDISSGEFLKLFGARSHIIESKELIFLDINSKGHSIDDFIRTLSGKATIYSEDGVIKRMNLLSKIFGLLNVYELIKGDVDLRTEGLRYKKTGASFSIDKGIFSTNDYIIDSASMVITGQGSLSLVDETIDGRITVSPLITIDKIVSNIPVLRNMLKDKKRGFIYAVYDVKGPIEDPDIKLGYIQTIGSLPLNILRGMLEFTKNLFNKIKINN